MTEEISDLLFPIEVKFGREENLHAAPLSSLILIFVESGGIFLRVEAENGFSKILNSKDFLFCRCVLKNLVLKTAYFLWFSNFLTFSDFSKFFLNFKRFEKC